jgi:threo-3-hydroxy-L-aspartate ammonia-lyase
VIGVEPAAGDDVTRSFVSGVIQSVSHPDTIADGARTSAPGDVTFPLIMQHVSRMLTVEDDALLRTMWYLWERMKIIVEPTGALAAAAVLEGKLEISEKRVGVILSGGNADIRALCKLLHA